jgi:ATP-dependent RNA helicase RhlE
MENTSGFNGLGIAPKLLELLAKNKYTEPTPIQRQSIPIAIEGKDLMGIAQTGTGKTLAFGIPMLQRLARTSGQKKGLVLAPTRELALQIDENLKKVGLGIGLKTAVLIGGESMGKQLKALRMNPNIIVATPGRLNDHLENSGLNLSNVGILVLDEADRMLDMGFAPQIEKILRKVPKVRQTMLFSATMPDEIVILANKYMLHPLRVEVAPAGSAVKTVTQELFFVDKNQKNELLKSLLVEYKGTVLVFSRTKYKAKDIARWIRNMGHTATEIHSNRSLGQRKDALDGFKKGKYRVLVATDIAARGIDVTGIQLVINYDLPATAEDYVHRIGRTGRAGMEGHAITFAQHDQRREVKGIERLIKKTLNVSNLPDLKTSAPAPSHGSTHSSHRQGNRQDFPRMIEDNIGRPGRKQFSDRKPSGDRGHSGRKPFGDRQKFGGRKPFGKERGHHGQGRGGKFGGGGKFGKGRGNSKGRRPADDFIPEPNGPRPFYMPKRELSEDERINS